MKACCHHQPVDWQLTLASMNTSASVNIFLLFFSFICFHCQLSSLDYFILFSLLSRDDAIEHSSKCKIDVLHGL